MNALTHIFISEHADINVLLNAIINQNIPSRREEMLKTLKIALMKHFGKEELFYARYRSDLKDILMTIDRLRTEHKLIIDILTQGQMTTVDVKKFLTVHEHIEENTLYPALEKSVSEKDIQDILQKFLTQI